MEGERHPPQVRGVRREVFVERGVRVLVPARKVPLVIPEVRIGGDGKVGGAGRARQQEGKEKRDANDGRENPFPERDHGRRTRHSYPRYDSWNEKILTKKTVISIKITDNGDNVLKSGALRQ
jgi:hypothetical protein